jgi:hypothetical protein
MLHAGAGRLFELHSREMLRTAVADRRVVDLARARLEVGDELLDVLDRDRLMIDHEHVGEFGHERDWFEVILGIV